MAVVSVLTVVVVVVTVSAPLGGFARAVVSVVAPAAAVVSVPIVERDTDEVSRAVAEVSRCKVLVSRGMPVVSRLIPVVSRVIPVVSRRMVVSERMVVSLRAPVVSVVGGVTGAGVGAGVGVGVGAAVVVSRRGAATAPAAELVSSPVVAPVSFCTRMRRVDVARREVVSVLVVVLCDPAVVSVVACAIPLAGSAIVNAAAMPNAKHVLVIREPICPSNRFILFDLRFSVSPSMSTPRHSDALAAVQVEWKGIEHAAAWGRCRFAPYVCGGTVCRDGRPHCAAICPE